MTRNADTWSEQETLAQWRDAAVAGFRDALPMFGTDALEVATDGGDDTGCAGAYIALEDDRHCYWLGVLQAPDRLPQVASLLLGTIDPGTTWAVDEVHDALRELANILAGGVKTRLLAHHGRLVLGLPFVVGGTRARAASAAHAVLTLTTGDVCVHLSIEREVHSPEKLHAIELERQLAEEEARLAGILNAAADGIVTFDEAGVIDTLNPAAERLVGIGANAARGRDLAAFVPGWRVVWTARRGDEGGSADAAPGLGETVLRRGDGAEIPVELSLARFAGKGGPMYAAILRDVTERRAIEGELRRAQKHEAIGRLAAGLAHELNTPAQYVGDSIDFLGSACADLLRLLDGYRRGFAALATAPAHAATAAALAAAEAAIDLPFLAEQVPDACQRSRHGVDRITAIVASMHSFARPSSGQRAPVDVNELVRVALTVAAAEHRAVAAFAADCADLPPVPCLRAELGQALLALLTNAAQAIADRQRHRAGQGHVRVATQRDRDGVAITIADDGCGVDPAIRERIFDPFFTTRSVGAGRGQGLSHARNIVEQQHGGRLTFTSQEGAGSQFRIWLPLGATTA